MISIPLELSHFKDAKNKSKRIYSDLKCICGGFEEDGGEIGDVGFNY